MSYLRLHILKYSIYHFDGGFGTGFEKHTGQQLLHGVLEIHQFILTRRQHLSCVTDAELTLSQSSICRMRLALLLK